MKDLFTINNQFKKYLPLFFIMLSITLLLGTSYALLRSTHQGENLYTMNVGLLEVTFLDSETNTLTIENMVPISDEEGMKTEQELSFTVKNTGSLTAMYNVYIEETSTSPEFKSVIRFISNKNNSGYNNPKTLSEDKYIDKSVILELGESINYKVKAWLAYEADSTYMDKTFTARIVLDVLQGNVQASEILKNSISKSTCNPTVTDDDGTIYFSGTNDCVDFNYVWYSGKLWRITAIYPDGTMKMITDGLMTTLNYGSDYNFYTDASTSSYIYQWLNQEFLPTLYNYEKIIKEDATWNASISDGAISAKLPVSGQEEVLVSASVGLLNTYEYYMSYKNLGDDNYSTGYLNIGYWWWLLNPYSDSSSYIWCVGNDGSGTNDNAPSYVRAVRPSVSLKSAIQLVGGTGTVSNPYKIKEDKEMATANTTLISARSSGEYVKLVNEVNAPTFRIVGIETINDTTTTKLVLNDYVRDTQDEDSNGDTTEVLKKAFGSTTSWSSESETETTYWRGYLNTTWLKEIDASYNSETGVSNILEKGTYYLGSVTRLDNYKLAVCNVVDNSKSVQDCIDENTLENPTLQTSVMNYSGLLRYGEMFASQFRKEYNDSLTMWLITSYNSAYVWDVVSFGYGGWIVPANTYVTRPTINLKSNIVIKSGSGTKQDPFVVGLPS